MLSFLPAMAQTDVSSPANTSNQIVVHFKMGYTTFQSYLEEHSDAMDEFIGSLKEAYGEGKLDNVEIYAYSCPAGDYRSCTRVAAKRAANLAAYITERSGIPSDMVIIRETGIAWGGLIQLVEEDSGIPDRDNVLRILRDTPEWIYDDQGAIVDGRKKQLMEVSAGRSFRYMMEHTFPQLRYASAGIIAHISAAHTVDSDTTASAAVSAVWQDNAGDTPAVAQPAAVAEDTLTASEIEEPTATAEPVTASESASTAAAETPEDTAGTAETGGSTPARMPRVAIKTNIPYWALVVPNLGAEVRLADHWTLDIPIFYSPFTTADTYRFRVLALQPGVRYWLKPGMKGHFFGVHLTGGMFNISVNDTQRFQDTDGAWGAGIDYGYALDFNGHWGMEFNIGVGYLWARYDTFYNIENGARYDTSTLNYLGVTRLGISLIYKL